MLTGAPSGATSVTSTTITVSGDDVEQYRYKLDSSNFTLPTSVFNAISLANLTQGAHTVQVLRLNNASKLQADPTTASWTVDSNASSSNNTGTGEVRTSDGTNNNTDATSEDCDRNINFPNYDYATYNETGGREYNTLAIDADGYNLCNGSCWDGLTDATALTYFQSGASSDLVKGLNLLAGAGIVERVLAGLICAYSPSTPNGWDVFVRNTTSLGGTYQLSDIRYSKVVNGTISFHDIATSEFSDSGEDGLYVYLRDQDGYLITDEFTGVVTIYAWVQDNSEWDENKTVGGVTDPGYLVEMSSGSSSGSSSSGCMLNPAAGFGPEWLLMLLSPILLWLRRRLAP